MMSFMGTESDDYLCVWLYLTYGGKIFSLDKFRWFDKAAIKVQGAVNQYRLITYDDLKNDLLIIHEPGNKIFNLENLFENRFGLAHTSTVYSKQNMVQLPTVMIPNQKDYNHQLQSCDITDSISKIIVTKGKKNVTYRGIFDVVKKLFQAKYPVFLSHELKKSSDLEKVSKVAAKNTIDFISKDTTDETKDIDTFNADTTIIDVRPTTGRIMRFIMPPLPRTKINTTPSGRQSTPTHSHQKGSPYQRSPGSQKHTPTHSSSRTPRTGGMRRLSHKKKKTKSEGRTHLLQTRRKGRSTSLRIKSKGGAKSSRTHKK